MSGPTFRSRFYFIRCGLSSTITRLCKGTHFDWSSAYRWCIVIDGWCEWNIGNRRKEKPGSWCQTSLSDIFSGIFVHQMPRWRRSIINHLLRKTGHLRRSSLFQPILSSLFLRWVSCECLSPPVAMMVIQVNSSTLLCLIDLHISFFHG